MFEPSFLNGFIHQTDKVNTQEDYLKNVLRQVHDAYVILYELKDQPGDLDVIKREIAKITGMLNAVIHKLESNKQELNEYQHLKPSMRFFLDNTEFFREIETMSLLYSDDPMRLKHLRLKILDSIQEKNLIGYIKSIIAANE